MKKLIYLLFVLGFGMSSCQETLITNVELDEDPKLVVGCFLNPNDSVIKATLSESRLLYRTSSQEWGEQIANATVIISNGSQEKQLVWSGSGVQGNGGYFLSASEMPIVPGQTYTLRVTHPDGRVVMASTTVPAVRNFAPSVSAALVTRQNEDFIIVNAAWRGQTGQTRYYRFNYGISSISSPNQSVYFMNSDFSNTAQYLTDRDAPDKLMTFREESYFWNQPGGGKRLQAQLQELDEHSYFYLSSLAGQGYNEGPFSEPAPIISNIQGGLGCFGSSYSYLVFSDPF